MHIPTKYGRPYHVAQVPLYGECSDGHLIRRSAPPIDLVWLTWSWMYASHTRNLASVSGWGALYLGNGSESQIRFLMRAPSVMWAVRGYTFRFLAPARPGDGALPNSDMRGRDPFLNEMIELLTQRARYPAAWISHPRMCDIPRGEISCRWCDIPRVRYPTLA